MDREIRGFAARYRDREGSIAARLRVLDSIFGGDVALLRMAMRVAEPDSRLTSFDSASTLLDSIKSVSLQVIKTRNKNEKETTYVFMHMVELLKDVNQRVSVASKIAEVMDNAGRTDDLVEKDTAGILSAINRTLGQVLSSPPNPRNFDDVVETAAAFAAMARALKNPESLIGISEILQKDRLAELQRKEKEEGT